MKSELYAIIYINPVKQLHTTGKLLKISVKKKKKDRTVMKLKTRIILGFTMIILMPLLLFAATLYGFSQSQAQKAQAVTESDGTVYDISITDSADSRGRVHVMAKDLFISAFVILISVALVVGLWVYRSIAVPLVKLKKRRRI